MNGNFPGFAGLSHKTKASYIANSQIASKHALLVYQPKISKEKSKKIIEFREELERLNLNYDNYFTEIKFIENNNLRLYCNSAESYCHVLNLHNFLQGN